MLQIKAEIIGKRYVNAELDLFRSVGVICNDKTVYFVFVVLHLLQRESYAEYAVRSIVACSIGDNRLEVTNRCANLIGKMQGVVARLNILLSTKSDALKTRLQKLESEKAEIEVEIDQAKRTERSVTKEQLLFWVDKFREGDATSDDFRDYLIETFINGVHVYKDKIAIVFNYTDEAKKKVTFIKESDLIPLECSTQLQLAPRVGLEPTTLRLTAACSTC